MKLEYGIQGKYINLRSVSVKDAEFIVKIRTDSEKNMYVHAVLNDVEAQEQWIKKQIEREGDYYFIIEDKELKSVGLCSVYDVGINENAAEFGRWISWGNAVQNVESVILALDFAFDRLNLKYVYMRTMAKNEKVKNFWKRFGAESYGEIYEMNLWLDKTIITEENYRNTLRTKNTKLLKY